MKDNKLEVGDCLYEKGNYGGLTKYVVERVTPTQAILSYSKKCKRESRDGKTFDIIDRSSWGPYCLYLATPEMDEQYRRQSLISFVKNGIEKKISLLKTSDLETIKKMIDDAK